MDKFATNASGAIWWPNLQPMQVVPSGGQNCNYCKWCHLVAKFVTYACSATWWPKLEPMLIALHVGQICNQCKWHLAGEITQVKESIPWVRCASGNVWKCTRLAHLLSFASLFSIGEVHRVQWTSLLPAQKVKMLFGGETQ